MLLPLGQASLAVPFAKYGPSLVGVMLTCVMLSAINHRYHCTAIERRIAIVEMGRFRVTNAFYSSITTDTSMNL